MRAWSDGRIAPFPGLFSSGGPIMEALISSAFTKTRDLQNLVANGAIAGAGFETATSGL
jgi:hypothetical protein